MNGAWLRAGLFLSILLLSVPASAQPRGLPDDLTGDAEAQGFADLLFAHGMVELAAGNYAAALPLFEKAARTLPSDATYAYFAGLCKLRLGRYGEALEVLRAVLPPAVGRISEARILFDLGDAYYRTGEYVEAQRELRRSTSLDAQASAAQFYLGLVEFAAGDMRLAFDAFGRATALDPLLTEQAEYYRGVEAYERGDLATAQQYFEQVLQHVADPGTTRSSREWVQFLEQLSNAEGLPPNDIRVSFFVEHDDNPGQINEDVFVPEVGSDVGSDVRGVVQMRAAHRPLISQEGNIGLVLTSYISRHVDFDEVDLAAVQGVFQYAYGGDPMGYINGPLGYARVPAGRRRVAWLFQAGASNLSRSEGSLRRDYEAASTVLWHQPTFGKSEFSLAYDDVTFFDDFNRPYSGHNTTIRLGQYFYLGEGPGRYLRLLIARTAHETREPALDHDSDVLQAELALPLTPRLNLFLLGAYREDDFDPQSAIFFPTLSQPRNDETIEAIVKLTWNVTAHGFLTFRYSFTDRDSQDLNFATYDRSISSLGFTRQW